SEFLRLAGPVLEFMEATPRIGDVSSAPARVAIAQPAATPAARFLIPDPLFELGHHVFRTCGERLSLQMSPIGTPSRSAEVTLGPRLTLAPAPQAAKTARKPTVSPALASGLKAAGLEKPLLETDETSCRITLSVAPASRSRKGSPETILSEDGVLYRKGLVSAAQPLCAALEARDACQR
ncbi:MAG TPA: hypothetical protein VM598_08130, partial [Bdellovibrionota bacterium]|nr:hypothetical protein [Bdellovibrionota bacterium]